MGDNYHWTTKDDKEIHIIDMESSHIKNVMRIIEKQGFEAVVRYGSNDYDEDYISTRELYENMRIELRLRRLEGRG